MSVEIRSTGIYSRAWTLSLDRMGIGCSVSTLSRIAYIEWAIPRDQYTPVHGELRAVQRGEQSLEEAIGRLRLLGYDPNPSLCSPEGKELLQMFGISI